MINTAAAMMSFYIIMSSFMPVIFVVMTSTVASCVMFRVAIRVSINNMKPRTVVRIVKVINIISAITSIIVVIFCITRAGARRATT